MIGFNPPAIYEIFYGFLEYGNSYIHPNLGNRILAFVLVLIFVNFIVALKAAKNICLVHLPP